MLGREVRLPSELIYGSNSNFRGEITSYGDYVDKLRSHMQDAHAIARKHLAFSTIRQETIYDSKMHLNHYKSGDTVWIENEINKPSISKKLQNAYRGPCLVTHKYNDLTYKVMLRKGYEKVMHHNKLKPYLSDDLPKWITDILSA